MPDVSMAAQTNDAATQPPKKPTLSPRELTLSLLRHNLALIVRSVIHMEPRFAARAMRTITTTRKLCLLHPDVLTSIVEEGTIKDSAVRSHLLHLLPPKTTGDDMDVDVAKGVNGDVPKKKATDPTFKHVAEATEDLDAYVTLLVIVYLVDTEQIEKVRR